MRRLVVLALLSMLSSACTYDPVSGRWYRADVRWEKPDIEIAPLPNSIEEHLAEQRYARDHHGHLPQPGTWVDP